MPGPCTYAVGNTAEDGRDQDRHDQIAIFDLFAVHTEQDRHEHGKYGTRSHECGKEITEEDVERYNLLSQEEKTALREACLKKKSEEMAADEALQKELEEKRRKDQEQYRISKAQDDALINEITDEIKSQITFDCKLKVSLTLTYIGIQAKIVDTGYTLSKSFLQKDRATALPQFVQALIAIHEVAGR